MSAHDFLRLILPSHGFYIGFARKGEARRQWVVSTIDELITVLVEASSKGWDAYHACSSFRDQRGVWVEHKGKVEFRCHQNILFVKSFWLDVDTKEGKQNAKYFDCQEAYQDSIRFCREAQLPKPCYVGSGRGLHLYWPVDEEMELGTWEVYASLFKAACVRLGFAADPSRTADASSILRTPGTVHQGCGKVVEHGSLLGSYPVSAFEVLMRFENGAINLSLPQNRVSITSELSRAVANVYGPPDSNPQIIATRCQQLQSFIHNPGGYSEPMHYSIAGLLAYCADGIDYFTSLLDPEWREVGRQKAEQWQAATTGPASCRRFEEINPGGCEGCPYKGEITSPIILGQGYKKAPEKTQATIQPCTESNGTRLIDPILANVDLPDCWKFSDSGQLVWQEENNKQELEDFVVSEYPIFLSAINTGEGNGLNYYSFQHYLPHGSWHTVNLPASVIFGPQLVSSMASLGAHVRDGKLFTRYCHDAVDHWNGGNKMNTCYEQCGWKEEDKAFLIGLQLHRANEIQEVVGDNDVQERGKHLRPSRTGSVRGWCSATNRLCAEKREAVNFAILCGFAAPLMRFQTQNEGGTIISLVNRSSGTGKSTTLDMVASIWGQKDGCSVEARDTAAGKGLLMACLGNLPIVFDEMASVYREKNPEALKELVELFSQGRDKIRAKQHGQGLQHTPGRWQTILLTASNLSIVDLLESTDRRGIDAPAYRVVELKVDYPRHLDFSQGDQLKFELFENAGHAGPAFIQHILKPEVYDFVQKALRQWTNEIWKQGGFRQEHRFWVRVLGACAVAGEVCRGMGLLPIDPHETIAWVIERLGVRGETKQIIPAQNESVEALGEYLNDRIKDILVVSNSWSHGDRPSIPERTPSGRLLVRYELQTGRLCVQQRDFKLWLVERGYPYSETLGQLAESKILTEKTRRVTLSAGTNMVSAPIICTEFDMKHPSVSGIVREVKSKLEIVK